MQLFRVGAKPSLKQSTVIPAKERHPVPRYGAGIHRGEAFHSSTLNTYPRIVRLALIGRHMVVLPKLPGCVWYGLYDYENSFIEEAW